ncbi:MAG TPA: hypothetical protein VN658_04235 [Candidatus Acidoferrales bacterium]|nr:hypothetical protein [Candidatus Acidoferrales bacterium]
MEKNLRIAAIVALTQNAPAKLGKTQVQKLVYFAQDAGVPLEYKYEIYHYGPYSFDLSRDLSSLDGLGVLNIESDPNGFGFDISVGKFAEKFKLDAKYQKKIEKVISQFGLNSSAELEVKATIHFVYSVVKKKVPPTKIRSEVIQKVGALKPRFTKDFIKNCYTNLEQASWI